MGPTRHKISIHQAHQTNPSCLVCLPSSAFFVPFFTSPAHCSEAQQRCHPIQGVDRRLASPIPFDDRRSLKRQATTGFLGNTGSGPLYRTGSDLIRQHLNIPQGSTQGQTLTYKCDWPVMNVSGTRGTRVFCHYFVDQTENAGRHTNNLLLCHVQVHLHWVCFMIPTTFCLLYVSTLRHNVL